MIRENYAIYNTTQSDGSDVCIVDPEGRYTLIHTDHWEQFVEDVNNYNRLYLAGTTFKEMRDDYTEFDEEGFLEAVNRVFNDLEDRGHL